MADFHKELQEARREMRDEETCDLNMIAMRLDEMEIAYNDLANESADQVHTLEVYDFVICQHKRYGTGSWDTTEPGDEANGQNPDKRYCATCGSEIVDGKCTGKSGEG